MNQAAHEDPFLRLFRGECSGILRWEQLDSLWERLREDAEGGWYIYRTEGPVPPAPVSGKELVDFVSEIDALLRREHAADYCGIVYVDDRDAPTLVKIYDPNNLGLVCGSSATPPLPGWVLSKLPPVDLPAALSRPESHARWWQRLLPH